MFDEDGSLDPLLKFLLYSVLTLAIGKMLWEWITEDVSRWVTVDLWGVITGHPWWTGVIAVGGLLLFLMLGRLVAFVSDASPAVYASPEETLTAPDVFAGPDMLTFRMKELSSMSATGFEQACSDLLARDGFLSPRRVGGAGDLGVDVTARDSDNRLLILQCKQYQSPVGSGHVQKFNGTARPHHGADLPIMIALNGFTRPATDFAQHHKLILVGRTELKQWAHGRHLYDVLGIRSTTP